jgi:hypothetical protein
MTARTGSHPGVICLVVLLFTARICLAETLRELLQREGIPSGECRSEDLEKQVTSGTAADLEGARFVATYVQEGDSSVLPDEFYLFRLDRQSGIWSTGVLKWPEPELGGTDGRVKSCQGGSLMRVDASDNFIYVDGHITPSASCTMVVTRDLKFHGTFAGWVVGRFKGDTLVYQHSQIHFAPTHYVELSLYDSASRTSRKIYPFKPYQAVRQAYIAEVQAVYDRCCPQLAADGRVLPLREVCGPQFGNHHCNAELFDNSLKGPVETDLLTDSLAFWTTFDDVTQEHPVVLYVFRNLSDPKKLQYREFLQDDLIRLFDEHPLSEYLSPEILPRLFDK